MNKLCRQVSIESPGPTLKECVFSFEVPVPEVPAYGARIRVAYAGACYRASRARSASVCSASSVSSVGSVDDAYAACAPTPSHSGLRDGALFPGYEVAGVVDAVGRGAEPSHCVREGTRIVLYPYEGVPHGYAEYIVVPDFKFNVAVQYKEVPDVAPSSHQVCWANTRVKKEPVQYSESKEPLALKCLVPVPESLPLSVAAMLPTGALLAMNTVYTASDYLKKVLEAPGRSGDAKILVVGTGGLALWALRIATHHFRGVSYGDRLHTTVASIRDEGFVLANESDKINVVQWSEDLYEKQLIERTLDACRGPVDVVMNFGTTSRSLHRSLQCLAPGGVVLVTEDVGEKLLPKFSRKAEELGVHIAIVPNGSIEQLRDLVRLVAHGEIEPPPHSVFPAEEVQEVVRKLCNSEIQGRAILRFHNID